MAITAVGQSQSFAYTGGIQAFAVPFDGIYKLEVYGASGNLDYAYKSGYGGYSCGYVSLKKNDTLHVVIGGQGSIVTGGIGGGGYNGGGDASTNASAGGDSASGGGGATHIAIVSGLLSERAEDYKDTLLIVAGGGGGCYSDGTYNGHGGAGGGLTGGNGSYGRYGGSDGGTQTSGYAFGQGAYVGNTFAGGGGGGFYGGKTFACTSGGGGSGYIGGVPEFTQDATTYTPSTMSGVNAGNGSAIITLVTKTASVEAYLGDIAVEKMYLGDVEIEKFI